MNFDNREYINVAEVLSKKGGSFGFEESLLKDFNKLISSGKLQESTIQEKKEEMIKALEKFYGTKEELNKLYEAKKSELLQETGFELNSEKTVRDLQVKIYDGLGIDKVTYKNNLYKRLSKGIIDGLIINNYDLIVKLIDNPLKLVKEIIENFDLKEIIKEIPELFEDIFSDDSNAYKRGKVIGEFLSIVISAGGAYVITKKVGTRFKTKINLDKKEKLLNLNEENIDDIFRKLENFERLSKEEIKYIKDKIDSNNPIFGIIDNLKNKDNFDSMIFTGVKALNDASSQAFTDIVLKRFKTEIVNTHPEIKVLWDDYKNFVVKLDKNNKFPENDELQSLLNNILDDELSKLSISERGKIRKNLNGEELGVLSNKGVVKGNTQKDIINSLAKTRSDLEKQNLGGNVLTKEQVIERESFLAEKYSLEAKKSQTIFSSKTNTKYSVRDGLLIKEFFVNGKLKKDRLSILEANGELNLEVITLVRKGLIPKELELYKEVKELLNGYIANGEFIAPYIKKRDLADGKIISDLELNDYREIISNLGKGHLDKKFINKIREKTEFTYKGSLDKNIFYNKISKEGELFFIDIKDMGSINMKDFSKQINKHNDGLISEKEILENSGDFMTNKFQLILSTLKKDLEKIYEGKKVDIYVGGDEISFFVEGVKDNIHTSEVISVIQKNLNKNLVEGRITNRLVNKDDIKKGGEKLVESIDKLTNYSKKIEKRISEIIEEIKIIKKQEVLNFELNDILNEKLVGLNNLKNFNIFIDNSKKFIKFNDLGEKYFLLENIIDLEKGTLKPYPGSPFLRYIIENNLGRESINKLNIKAIN